MKRIDDTMPVLRPVPVLIIVIVLGVVLEMTGAWMTMFIAGGIGALFVRRTRHAFIAGFFGVAIAWALIFLYLIVTAQALGVADVFASLLGVSDMGGLVITISVLIGGLLGGSGGVLARSTIELIDNILVPAQPSASSSS